MIRLLALVAYTAACSAALPISWLARNVIHASGVDPFVAVVLGFVLGLIFLVLVLLGARRILRQWAHASELPDQAS